MKNLFNDMSQQEKNNILEMHGNKKNIIKEDGTSDKFAYGHKDINSLYDGLDQDEDIYLTDNSGELRGDIVKKKQYVINMLKKALNSGDWSIVNQTILYINTKM